VSSNPGIGFTAEAQEIPEVNVFHKDNARSDSFPLKKEVLDNAAGKLNLQPEGENSKRDKGGEDRSA
jgi:hypothetical protein